MTDEYALWLVHDNVPTTNRPMLVPVGKTIDVGDGYTLTALRPVPWSGLTYRRDPGESFVGLGAAVLVAGFVMALFFVPIKVYARVRADQHGSAFDIAATTTKGNSIYEREFAQLLEGVRRAGAITDDPRGQTEKAYA